MISLSASLITAALAQANPPPAPAPIIIEPVFYFTSGSSRPLPLNQRNYEVLRDHALRPDVTAIIVSGHTDTVGSEEANRVLSEQRGQTLADTLTGFGVSPSLIRIEARGEAGLRAPPPTTSMNP